MKTTDNGIEGPIYLEQKTEHIINPDNLEKHEWLRRLVSSTGGKKFNIKYYGDLMGSLIIATDFAPQKVEAIDTLTGEHLVIFDGCAIGYNALFCDMYTEDDVANRPTTQSYVDGTGADAFEVILSAYYGIDYDDEFSEEVDENGMIELINGQKDTFENVKRNGCDTFQVWIINDKGQKAELISEELA